jgi:COP9 signalosome complex subunit 3
MDDLLPKLLAFPPQPQPPTPLSDSRYDEAIKDQIVALAKIADKALLQQTAKGESALDVSITVLR